MNINVRQAANHLISQLIALWWDGLLTTGGYNLFQYRDRNKNALEIIKRKRLLPSDSTVFILELELKTSEIEFDIEKQSYPLVKTEALSGFFGLNLFLEPNAEWWSRCFWFLFRHFTTFCLTTTFQFYCQNNDWHQKMLAKIFSAIQAWLYHYMMYFISHITPHSVANFICWDWNKCNLWQRYNSVKHRCSLAKEEISYSFDQCRDLERYEVASKRNSDQSLPPPPPYFTH